MKSPEVRNVTEQSRKGADLVRRYERIGISAVAAALACRRTTAKEESAPTDRERQLEATD